MKPETPPTPETPPALETPPGGTPVLPVRKGWVKLINSTRYETSNPIGVEAIIADAARVSYNSKPSSVRSSDGDLILYLMTHQHWGPFEFIDFVFEIQTEIFTARQMFRYRTASFNEVSARYTEMPELMYEPVTVRRQSIDEKQKSSSVEEPLAESKYRDYFTHDYSSYKAAIKDGVAKEQARATLPVGTYTRFWMKINLRNLFNVFKQRLDHTAQSEICEVVTAMWELVKSACPLSCAAYEDIYMNSTSFTKTECLAMQDPKTLATHLAKLSPRRRRELLAKLKKIGIT